MTKVVTPKVSKLIKQSEVFEAKGQTDTIRLWENYRDQATMWRALALLQIPATFIAIVFALVMWNNTTPIFNIPLRPLPGQYRLDELPEATLIENATDFINLISTYQPAVVRRQYLKAREYVDGEFLTKFDREMVNAELQTIENTNRTQIFFTDPSKTEVERFRDGIVVKLQGDRLKIVAGREMPLQATRYSVKLTTVPKNELNPYGIVVSDLGIENVTSDMK